MVVLYGLIRRSGKLVGSAGGDISSDFDLDQCDASTGRGHSLDAIRFHTKYGVDGCSFKVPLLHSRLTFLSSICPLGAFSAQPRGSASFRPAEILLAQS